MAEEFLDRPNVVPCLQQVGRERVAERVAADALRDSHAPEASVTARCTAESWRWYRDGRPYRGSRQMRAAGNTNCHFQSVGAFGYFRSSARRKHDAA